MANKNIIRYLGILLILIGMNSALVSDEISANQNWSSGTAYLLPVKRYEIGIFQPLRYGLSETRELSLHPIFAFVSPNLSLKLAHDKLGKLQFASDHGINYPTILMNLISREGTGGIISPEFEIPHMISIYNGVILSKPLGNYHLITVKAGFNFAIKFGDLDKRTTIDLPLVFPRLNVFYNGYGFRSGCDLKGKIFKKWYYLADVDIFYFPGAAENFAFEHKGLIQWNKSKKFQLCVGYKLSYGNYPFGSQWHLLPAFDIRFAKQLKTKK